jgi:hypothetical protein
MAPFATEGAEGPRFGHRHRADAPPRREGLDDAHPVVRGRAGGDVEAILGKGRGQLCPCVRADLFAFGRCESAARGRGERRHLEGDAVEPEAGGDDVAVGLAGDAPHESGGRDHRGDADDDARAHDHRRWPNAGASRRRGRRR